MQPLEMEQNGDVRRNAASGKTKRWVYSLRWFKRCEV